MVGPIDPLVDLQGSAGSGSQTVVRRRSRPNSLGRRLTDRLIDGQVSQDPQSLYAEKEEGNPVEENLAEIGYNVICAGL
jgi:hypothetical protein